MLHLALITAHFGNHDEAQKLVRDAMEILRNANSTEYPVDAVEDYYLACIAAIQSRKDEALSQLRRSVELGVKQADTSNLATDPDLRLLFGDPQFAAILSEAKQKLQAAQRASTPASASAAAH
jgi:hypothetical protein